MIAIADVAGQYDALMRLVARFSGRQFVLLGDLVDRGPKSKQVVEWAMNSKNVVAIKGNHEHMMVDWVRSQFTPDHEALYAYNTWFNNGGLETLISYGNSSPLLSAGQPVPESHLIWLENLPHTFKYKNFLFSHAAISSIPHNDPEFLWNRGEPKEIKGEIQVMGHNSHWGLRFFGPVQKPWAICLDQSREKLVTALDCDNMIIYAEPYEAKCIDPYHSTDSLSSVVYENCPSCGEK